MNNFVFDAPTKLIFGKGTEAQIGSLVRPYTKKVMMLHYGQEFIYTTGLHGRITDSLKAEGIEIIELTGIVPNPKIDLVREGIRICREEGIGFLLAVGGGSVIDTAKAISFGSHYDGDPWDLFNKTAAVPEERIPVGVILTIAATGSESNCQAVISNDATREKLGIAVPGGFPEFAVMNPELTCSLPRYQTAAACVDIIAHVLESYIIDQWDVDINDRLCEAIMRSVIYAGKTLMKDPTDYQARAELMWASNLACKGFLSVGCELDGTSHCLEHELGAWYPKVTHGAGLAVIQPAWLKEICLDCVPRLAKFACNVWGCEYDFGHPERTAFEGIQRMEEFFEFLGMPLHLRDFGVKEEDLEPIARSSHARWGSIASIRTLTPEDYISIMKACW